MFWQLKIINNNISVEINTIIIPFQDYYYYYYYHYYYKIKASKALTFFPCQDNI